MSAMSLDMMLEAFGNHARLILLQMKQPQLTPIYHLVTPGEAKDVLIAATFRDADEKDRVVAHVRALAHAHHALALGFMGEVWMTSYTLPNLPAIIPSPAQSPDRIEAVCATVTDGITIKTRSWQIVRTRPGGPIMSLVEMSEEGATTTGGRMVDDILP